MHRNNKVSDQKKVLPLQIHSPSMMKTFQKASSTENLHNRTRSSRFSTSSKTHKKAPENHSSNSFSTDRDSPRNQPRFPKFSKVVSHPRDTNGVKETEVNKPVNQKDFQANTTHKNNNKSNISLVGMPRNEVYAKTANESLASRAKRSSEDKIKHFCNNICVPSELKNLKSQKKTADFPKHAKALKRYSSTSSESLYNLQASSSCCEKERNDKQFQKQPIHSLIRVYDRSLKDKISVRKESNICFERTN